MPRPCDPGSPREPRPAQTHWALSSQDQRNRGEDGEGAKGHLGFLLPISRVFILLLSPFVSPEPQGEQIPRKETWFLQGSLPPRQPSGVHTAAHSPRLHRNKGLSQAKSRVAAPSPGQELMSQSQPEAKTWFPCSLGSPDQAASSPLSRKEDATQKGSKCPFQD